MDHSSSAAPGSSRHRQPRRGTRAAVAAGSAAAADVAAEVLRRGGNAVDAVVAGALAATVAEPILASLGGGGFCVVSDASGRSRLVDFFVAMPGLDGPAHRPTAMSAVDIDFGAASQVFHVGPASVATPGMIPGLRYLTEHLGSQPFERVAQPAVELARRGAVVDPVGARVLTLVWPVLASTERGRAMFSRARSPHEPLRAGERYRLDGYADLLGEIARGHRFDAPAHGGGISARDLADYRVIERDPLRVRFGDTTILTNPAPSFGGTLIAHALGELAESSGPRSVDITAWADANRSMTQERDRLGRGTSRGTTHLSVVDGDGLAASLTTSNGSGSGVFVDGTPIQLNNMLGEDDLHPGGFGQMPPGARIGSMMAPLVIEQPDGTVIAAGSGGSERIRSALLALLLRLVVRGESLQNAVDGPRLHWDGSRLQIEPGFDERELAALAQWGPTTVWPSRDFFFGGVHAAAVGPSAVAVGDTRRNGAGRVVDNNTDNETDNETDTDAAHHSENQPPGVARVVAAGAQLGLDIRPLRFPDGTRTAEDAAAAIGCELGQIVKSLVVDVDGEVVIACVSGTDRLSETNMALAAGGVRCRRVDAETVRSATGFAIGGVPPLGHSGTLRIFIDRRVLGHDQVWAAAGSGQHVFAAAPRALAEAVGASITDIAQE